MQTLRKLFELTAREFWVLVQAAVLLRVVHCALNFVTIARLQHFGGRPVARTATDHPATRPSRRPQNGASEGTDFGQVVRTVPRPEAIARLVRVAAERGPYRVKCLERSLVLRWLLQRQGIDAQILFGARKEDEQMQAHAWVVVDGVALSEDEGVYRDFSPFEEAVSKG